MNVSIRPNSERLAVATDLAIVLAVTATTEWSVWVSGSVPGPRWLTAALPLLLALPLRWRRRRALLAGTLVMAGVVIQALASGNSTEGFELIIALSVAAYSIGAYSERRHAFYGLALLVVGYSIYALEDHNIRSGRTGELWAGAFFAVELLAFWLIGVFVHGSRERTALHAAAAERERAAEAAVFAERSRIAGELHDIVSHNLSVVVLQAGGARAQGANAPANTLEKIEQSSRQALVEMRRLLGVLRETDADPELAPQPGLGQLEVLATTMEAAGLPVELTVEGADRGLPPALDLSVYRIVQEALTNTLKHAHATHARVRIRCDTDAITVEVVDDGSGRSSADSFGSGHGLIGMRERVALFGGELSAVPRPDGGFAVHARLPIADAS